jgi:hypothetical protein
MCVDEIRLQRYEIVIASQSLIGPLQPGKCHAQGVPCHGRLWINLQALPQKTRCRFEIAAPVLGHCEHVQSIEVQLLIHPAVTF